MTGCFPIQCFFQVHESINKVIKCLFGLLDTRGMTEWLSEWLGKHQRHLEDSNVSIFIYFLQNRLHLTIICVATTIPTNHSIIWWSPRPGHRPRFDPRKLRESMKLNWSTVVFLTLTSLSKLKLTVVLPVKDMDVIFFLTVAVVRRQGSRQSDTRIP